MTLHQLRIFNVVSQHLNITKASAELHLSQPSVFQQIKSLEESCGFKLYRKVGRGIALTRAGERLCADAREILERMENLQKRFGVTGRLSETLPLRVGGSHVPSKSILPVCLTVFKQNRPLVRVTLQTGSSRNIEHLVQNSELDIAVITHPSHSSDLEYAPFRHERIVLFVSGRHPFAKKNALSLAEVAMEPLIVHRGIHRGTGEITLNILKCIEDQGRKPNILMECSSGEAVKAAVIGGAGIGILMEGHLHDEIRRDEVKILSIRDVKDLMINSFIVYQKRKPLSDNAQNFFNLLRQNSGGEGRETPGQTTRRTFDRTFHRITTGTSTHRPKSKRVKKLRKEAIFL
jgi:LysR family transcriptional regulator, low CO2-responsive transcriptional regulator